MLKIVCLVRDVFRTCVQHLVQVTHNVLVLRLVFLVSVSLVVDQARIVQVNRLASTIDVKVSNMLFITYQFKKIGEKIRIIYLG